MALRVPSSLLILAILMTTSVVYATDSGPCDSNQYLLHNAGLVQSVPYVWQEMNGFCSWAATSIAMQSAGININMHKLFAVSGVGFSFAYIRYNDTLLLFPGALYQQINPTHLACQIYGLNYTAYFGADIEGIETQISYMHQDGINAGLIQNQEEAFNLMRGSIDEGHPLTISVNPIWLPAIDYDILRNLGLSGGGHAVVVVGYNDTSQIVTIIDPGVGSFGENFGYPDDMRGNYTEVSYANLNLAWSSRKYISVLIKPSDDPIENAASILGPYLRDRFLGVGESYAPGSASAYIWGFGKNAFLKMADDLGPEGLKSYLAIFDGMQNERAFKSSLLKFIGIGLESQVTLQYLSYRKAVNWVPELLGELDLVDFMEAANRALEYFEPLADNRTLIHPGNYTDYDSLVSSTFGGMASLYNETGDLDATITEYASALNEITANLQGIGVAWNDAGEALAVHWPNNPLIVYGPLLLIGGGVVGLILIAAVSIMKKTPSQ